MTILLPEDADTNEVTFTIKVHNETLDTRVQTQGFATCERKADVVKAACCFLLATVRQNFGDEFIQEILAQPILVAEKEEKEDGSA